MDNVKAAFAIVNKCRRLPVLLEGFLGERMNTLLNGSLIYISSDQIRQHHYLITREVLQHMTEYEVCADALPF